MHQLIAYNGKQKLSSRAIPATVIFVFMKKRYIASPLLILALAATWNIALRHKTPIATAQDIQPYVAPPVQDSRHPIDVFVVQLSGGETQNDVIAHLPTTVYPEDKVSFVVNPGWGLGTIVHVERALPLTIHYGRRTFAFRTWSNTVEEALAQKNLELGELDKSNVRKTDLLVSNMSIDIIPVSKTNVTVKEIIAFDTINKDDSTQYRGVTKVDQQGQNGERTKIYEINREDGIEVSRKLIGNDITTPAKNKVVLHGTKLKIGKVVSGKVTFYDLCCTKVASNSFKKGTVLRLTNMNNGKQVEVTVDDTGAFGSSVVVDLHPTLFQQLGGTIGQGVMQNVKAEEILNP